MSEELSAEQIAELARRQGLPVDAARAETLRAGLNSLLSRTRRLGEMLPGTTEPPPTRAPR